MSRISLRQAKIRSLFHSNVDTSMQVRRLNVNTPAFPRISASAPYDEPWTPP